MRSAEKAIGGNIKQSLYGPLNASLQATQQSEPLIPLDPPVSLDIEEVSAILEHGGEFSRYFEHYEQRPEQIEMLQAVAHAISESQHLMVEAGTGVGKSFAYLIPAVLWSTQNGLRVVISTNTINLQDQLINKDIPDLQAAIDIQIQASVLKGRGNYLCPHQLDSLRRRGPESCRRSDRGFAR